MIVQGNGRPPSLLIGGAWWWPALASGSVAGAMGLAWLCIGRAALLHSSPALSSQDHRFAANYGRLVTPDTPASFFVMVALCASLLILRDDRTWPYSRGGAAGLAASTKYNAAFVLFPLLVAHVARCRRDALRHRGLYVALGAACVGFAAATPSILFDPGSVIGGLRAELAHYRTGHRGPREPTRLLRRRLWQQEGAVVLLAPVSLARCRFKSRVLIVATFRSAICS